MDEAEADRAVLAETTVFLSFFKDLPDHRQPGKVIYPLDEILLLSLLAVLAGAETFTDIARFGEKKLALLRRFRPFANGTPAHDHLGDIFATLDAEAFRRCFVTWVSALIAKKINDKKADYIIALKRNQGTLHEDVKLFVAEQEARDFEDTVVTRHETIDGEHGRIETRKYTLIHDVAWLKQRHDWPGLSGIVIVESTRETASKTEQETRFYITSLGLPAETVGPMIRDHWAIENSLHWVMDMVFRDDECRVRTENAPANFVTLKHMANNLIRRAPGKDSQRLKRMTAAWDDDFLASLVAP